MSASRHGTMSQRRGSALSFAGARRLVSVLCAFAFLTVGLAHAFTEHDEVRSQIVASNISSDQPTGTAGHAVPCDHCYQCTGAVAPIDCVVTVVSQVETDLFIVPVLALHSHAPGFHTPPPKLLA